METERKQAIMQNEMTFNNAILVASTEIDSENKIVKAVLSDETPVMRFGWEEGIYDIVLSHDADAVDLSRSEIMPLLVQHNREMLPIGRWENLRIENKKLKGDAVFDSEDKLAMEIFGKFERGFMKSFSIGIGSWEKQKELDLNQNNRPQYKAVKWSLDECSVVTIPANHNAKASLHKVSGVNPASAQITNSNQGEQMSIEEKNYSEQDFKALEEKHAEALSKIEANHATALVEAKAEQRKLSKEVVVMAMARGLDSDQAVKMLDADTMTEAKAMLVDSMSMEANGTEPSGAEMSGEKKDHWADFNK